MAAMALGTRGLSRPGGLRRPRSAPRRQAGAGAGRGAPAAAAGARRAASNAAIADAPAAFLPAEMDEIVEPAARALAARMRLADVRVAGRAEPVPTSFVGPDGPAPAGPAPFLLLHGFDSSCLEFRRLMPLLDAEGAAAYAVDMLGWGFTDAGPEWEYSQRTKREHLYAFWEQHVGRPVVLVGASVGGAAAIDFAHAHPEAVEKLVLVDAQGHIDGLGPMALLPPPVARAGANVLRSKPLRRVANQMAYCDKEKLATEDAVRVGRLHCNTDGWLDNTVAWMRSGGYSVSKLIPKLTQPTMVVWGRQDEILEPALADRFESELSDVRVQWVEQCGHVAHLEQPAVLTEHLLAFRDA